MAIVRVNSADVDRAKLLEEVRNLPRPTEDQIEAWAAEDDDAWTEEDFARARVVYPPPRPADIRALRERLGLTAKEFADLLGFTAPEIEQLEQDGAFISAQAATLLWVMLAEPEAVVRAVKNCNARFRAANPQDSLVD
jgi:putative transcriptional regulator